MYSSNTLCSQNFLLHRGLFAFSEDTLSIKELEELPVLLKLGYPEGLTIPLQSLPSFAEAFDTT